MYIRKIKQFCFLNQLHQDYLRIIVKIRPPLLNLQFFSKKISHTFLGDYMELGVYFLMLKMIYFQIFVTRIKTI